MSEELLTPEQQDKLLRKVQMKYGIELQAIQERVQKDLKLHGYVTIETELERDSLLAKIKSDPKMHQIRER